MSGRGEADGRQPDTEAEAIDRQTLGEKHSVLAQWPSKGQLPPATFVSPPHPSVLSSEAFESRLNYRFQTRSGPGGQHRNRVATGAYVTDQPTGAIAEATEQRSQARNRREAIRRLRIRLALGYRTSSMIQPASRRDDGIERTAEMADDIFLESDLHRRWTNSKRLPGLRSGDHAGVLALILNDLYAAGGQPSLVASHWHTSTGSVVRCLKTVPEAFRLINHWRSHFGRGPLH